MVLSATDLILVISVPTMFLVKGIREIPGTPRCLYSICFSVVNETTPLLSATSLIIMNIERYLAFFHPIFHRTRATKGNILFTFIIIWCIFFTRAVINLAWHGIGCLIYSVGPFFICSTTLAQYLSIFIIARKALFRRVTKVSNEETTSSIRSILRDLEMPGTYCFIVCLCFICYLPIVIITRVWQHFFSN